MIKIDARNRIIVSKLKQRGQSIKKNNIECINLKIKKYATKEIFPENLNLIFLHRFVVEE